MSVCKYPRPGRHSTQTKDGHVDRDCALIPENRRLTVREVADEVDISKDLAVKHFTEKNSDASRQCKIRAASVDCRGTLHL
jgi:hypothetical protein